MSRGVADVIISNVAVSERTLAKEMGSVSTSPKKSGLGIDRSPARRAALAKLLATLVPVKVDPSLRPSR